MYIQVYFYVYVYVYVLSYTCNHDSLPIYLDISPAILALASPAWLSILSRSHGLSTRAHTRFSLHRRHLADQHGRAQWHSLLWGWPGLRPCSIRQTASVHSVLRQWDCARNPEDTSVILGSLGLCCAVCPFLQLWNKAMQPWVDSGTLATTWHASRARLHVWKGWEPRQEMCLVLCS